MANTKLTGFNPQDLFKEGSFEDGQGDLIVGGDWAQILGRMAAYYTSFFTLEDKEYFQGITIILPPSPITDILESDIHNMILKGVEDIYDINLTPNQKHTALENVQIFRCNQLDINDVCNAIVEAGNKQIVLIPESNKFVDPMLDIQPQVGRIEVLLPEDIWVPHVASLATSALLITKKLGSVLVLSANEESPKKQINIQMLIDVDKLYPAFVNSNDDKNKKILNTLSRCLALTVTKNYESALIELKKSDIDVSNKELIELQLAYRAGFPERSLELLRKFQVNIDGLAPDIAATLGNIAFKFDDYKLAKEFFSYAFKKNLSNYIWLEKLLDICWSTRDKELFNQCWCRIATLFPKSEILTTSLENRLLDGCQSKEIGSDVVILTHEFNDFHNYIADILIFKRSQISTEELIETVNSKWPQQSHLAALCIALHAFNEGFFGETIKYTLVAIENDKYLYYGINVLLGCLRKMFLFEEHNLTPEGTEIFLPPLHAILSYLSQNPDDGKTRSSLSAILSVEHTGSIGLPLIASFVANISSTDKNIRELKDREVDPASEETLKKFLAESFDWIEENPVELGVSKLPESIIDNNADALIASLERLIDYSVKSRNESENLLFVERCTYLICMLQPYSQNTHSDIDSLRLLAATFFLHGKPQRARDLAEQIVNLAGDSSERQRVAWVSFADIYQRTRDSIDALIGLACANLTNATTNPRNLSQEAYTLLRLARDLHLNSIARQSLTTCRELYKLLDLGDKGRVRLDGVEIGLDLINHTELDDTGLLNLLNRAYSNCQETLNLEDEVFPPSAQFLQIAGIVERKGLNLPDYIVTLREIILGKLPAELSLTLKTASDAHPKIESVVHLYNNLEPARYSENIAADLLSIVVMAHRLLLTSANTLSAQESIVAIELLSDHLLQQSKLYKLDLDWPVNFALELSSKNKLGILFIATDANGELVSVIVEAGELMLIRHPVKEKTFENRIQRWRQNYPYRYGLIERDEGNGEFYTTMQDFEIPIPISEKIIIVAQPSLQQLPFNLALFNQNFIGYDRALCVVPSLTWLRRNNEQPLIPSVKRNAWISCNPDSENYGTLEMLFDRLSPLFQQYAFTTYTDGNIPEALKNSRMAIVTAHGQLTNEQRYIHRIADEQQLTESPKSLVRALAKTDIVILFVCSGGRVDTHPIYNTTISLPKMLLGQGCKAVIASPWPLSSNVPYHWLDGFMKAWEQGKSIFESNLQGNLKVQERLGLEPGLGLAMTVYGNGLLTE